MIICVLNRISFDTVITLISFSDTKSFCGVFVRPPKISNTAKPFHVIATKEEDGEEAVCIEYENILACTFYPEFTSDLRVHEYFLTKV